MGFRLTLNWRQAHDCKNNLPSAGKGLRLSLIHNEGTNIRSLLMLEKQNEDCGRIIDRTAVVEGWWLAGEFGRQGRRHRLMGEFL
jgi:hypothetical protein